jgi:hypothetical protein
VNGCLLRLGLANEFVFYVRAENLKSSTYI